MSKADTLAKLVSAGGPLVDGAIAVSDISGLQTTLDGKLALSGGTLTGNLTFNGTQTWPTFNQNTTGSAATATTATNVSGGTANVTTLTTSSTVTLNGGTANGVSYLNGSKVLTTGSALIFNGTNLGLGVTPSAWGGSFVAYEGVGGSVGSNSSGDLYILQNAYFDGTNFVYKNSLAASYARQTSGQHRWYIAPSGTAGANISFTQAMTLDANGRLGIGTVSPAQRLDVTGVANSVQARFGNVVTRGLEIGTTLTGGTNDATSVLNARGSTFGQLLFQTDGTNRMLIDYNGNVGIGTSSPTYKFEIRDQNNVGFGLYQSNDNDGALVRGFRAGGTLAAPTGVGVNANLTGLRGFGYNSSGAYSSLSAAMDFYAAETFTSTASGSYITFRSTSAGTTSPTERMRITDSGNVGIGTNSPQSLLDVKNGSTYSSSGTWLARVQQNTNGIGQNGLSVMNAWAASSSTIFEAAMGWNGSAAGYYPVFTVDGLGQVIFRPERTEAMRITNTGLVGIGTSNPTERLLVSGGNIGIQRTASDYSVLSITNTSGVQVHLNANGNSEGNLRTVSNHPLSFSTNNTERARITSAGDLGIGTSAPESKLDVRGNGQFVGYTGGNYQLSAVSPSGADRQVFIAGVLGISNGLTVRYVSGAMQYIMTGLGTGTVSSSGGVLSASSDKNMKVEDGLIDSGLEKVLALQPRYFYWKDKDGIANEAAGRQLGFFAQEVHEVLPEAAPSPKTDQGSWGVYDRSIVAALVKAIQEQQAAIIALTDRITTLESN